MLWITADVHERASGVPELLGALGVLVEVRPLARGDYILGPETAVERKTALGLHLSIQEGRFWRQMGELRETGDSPVLVVEGQSVFSGPVANDSIRGLLLAVADLGITIIHAEDVRDTAAWLYRLATRRRDGAARNRPIYAQRKEVAGHLTGRIRCRVGNRRFGGYSTNGARAIRVTPESVRRRHL